MKMKNTWLLSAAFVAAATMSTAGTLDEGFRTPPRTAKPHTWYHMMNGNVTKEGITCDFEALAKAGIGGVQMFDAGCDVPAGPMDFNSPAWFDMFAHAQKEAKRLGLEICIPNCSGWSSSGGPWNPPANGMKRVVYTETAVKGPTTFADVLPREKNDNGFYADIAVLAYPTPKPGAKISNLAEKTFAERGITRRDTTPVAPEQTVAKDKTVELTAKMGKDGRLVWDVPAGDWTILRVGYICNGRCNHPASDHGRGLEVDKLSASAMDYHFEQYVARLCQTLGVPKDKIAETGFNNILVDSYEVASQNWTQDFDKTFARRMGYSLIPYMPVFAGRVVGSVEESERFLEDFRRVVADLFAENYAGRLTELCHRHGLLCSIEPYGNCPSDDLQYGQDIDVPMAEFWSNAARGDHHQGDIGNSRLAAALAHVWGRRYAATESFTADPGAGGRWRTTPFSIKSQGDRVYAAGINRIIYHRFTHQPWAGDKYLPGMTMGRWGMHLDRTQTWWKYAPSWFDYQSRCQWMLQEGTFVADVLFWCGEDVPQGGVDDSLPVGYDKDICATKALMALTVKDGRVVVPGGVSYALLALPQKETMSPACLKKIGELIDAGAKVCGVKKPVRAPGLRGWPQADQDVKALADAVWAKGVMAKNPGDALKALGIEPDFTSTEPDPSRGAVSIHRRDASADWYFVALDNEAPRKFEASFRLTGRVPEIWDAETGAIAEAKVWRTGKGRTTVMLEFPPSGSAFVVFRRASANRHLVSAAADVKVRPEYTVPKKAHTLEIKKAEYGVFNGGRRDCARVSDFVKPGRPVGVNNVDLGGDPVPNKVKAFEAIYWLNGKRCRDLAQENSRYTLPAGAKLEGAWYGLIDPTWEPPKESPVIDVTAKVAAAVENGEINLRIENDELAGRDPLFLVPKEFRVTYVYDGEEVSSRYGEHSVFALPEAREKPQPAPTWELTKDGGVLAWQPLTAKLVWSDGAQQTVSANPPASVLVTGAWDVAFPAGWSAPASVTFNSLMPWNEHSDTGVKYFSGTATYTKKVAAASVKPLLANGGRVMLDLGTVKNFAEVTVNGTKYPVLWKPPFRVDVTDAVANAAEIDVEVKVTNLWPNRLIGDDRLYADDCEWNGKSHKGKKEFGVKRIPDWVKEGQPSPTGRHTFTTWKHWSKEDPLQNSGLLGPVQFRGGVVAK